MDIRIVKNHDADMEEQEIQVDVATVFRSIFGSCDIDNTDLVQASKLIEFIRPFMTEDLNALEDLRVALDPERKDAFVSSERFYEVMGHWSQKIAAASSKDDNEFNRSASHLNVIEDKDLPYNHSTPRASLGDKLLRCKDLLNLSNVSGYSLSTSRLDTTNPTDADKTVLEEEIKKLEHHLSKTTNELAITKQQLASSEEQNEILLQDLDRLNRRLHAEQQVNEHLQRDKVYSEELREELNGCKKVMDDLKKKLSQSEKDAQYFKDLNDELEKEKAKIEKKNEVLSRQNQECMKEIFDIRTELNTREQQIGDIKNVYDELKSKFAEQKDIIDQLREEKEILCHQKSTLERAVKTKSVSSEIYSNLGNLNLNLSTASLPSRTHFAYSPGVRGSPVLDFQNGTQPKSRSRPLIRKALGRHSSTPINTHISLLDYSLPDSIKTVPVLSPVCKAKHDGEQERQDSSEEDLCWQLQQDEEGKVDANGMPLSLQTEMHRANSVVLSDTYQTSLFERDEQIAELEEELEYVKKDIKDIENEKDVLATELEEQKNINQELVQINFVATNNLEVCQTKMESLKQRIAQLEQMRDVVENDQETSQADLENRQGKIRIAENSVDEKEIGNVILWEKQLAELKETLKCVESEKNAYDARLKEVMRDFGQISVEKFSLEEKLKALKHEKELLEEQLGTGDTLRRELKEQLELVTALRQKNFNLEDSVKKLVSEKDELAQSNLALQNNLQCSQSKVENLLQRLTSSEGELIVTADQNTNENIKKKMLIEFEQEIKLKDDEVKNFKATTLNEFEEKMKIKDEELQQFKESLEKKIVKEFEGKVKYSMEAEEKILTLTNRADQQEKEIKNLMVKLSSKSRGFADAKNEITKLNNLNAKLQDEVNTLNASKNDLETRIDNLRTEYSDTLVKLEKINNIDAVATEVQRHINERNLMIDELRELNKKMQRHLNEAQTDSKHKVDEIFNLRNELRKDIGIKNDLWKKLQNLRKQVEVISALNEEYLVKEQFLFSSNEELKIEYNNLLVIYDIEVNKNSNLNNQVYQLNEERNWYCTEYNELKQKFEDGLRKFEAEQQRNAKLSETLSECKAEMNEIEARNKDLLEQLTRERKSHVSENEPSVIKSCEEQERNIKDMECEHKQLNQELKDLKILLSEKDKQKEEMNRRLLKELYEIKQEKDKLSEELQEKLQHELERSRTLTEDLSQLKQKMNEKVRELAEIKRKMAESGEKNSKLTEELSHARDTIDKNLIELAEIKQKLKNNETEVENKNKDLLEKLTELETLVKQRQVEIEEIRSKNKQLLNKLILTKREKDQINSEFCNEIDKNKRLTLDLSEKNTEFAKLMNDFTNAEQEKEKLATESKKNSLLSREFKHRLEEEVNKNKTLFEKFMLVKTERDQSSSELKEIQALFKNSETLMNKRQNELKLLQTKCTELETTIQQQSDLIKRSDITAKRSLEFANSKIKTIEKELSETRQELDEKTQENAKLILELDEAKRKCSTSYNQSNSDGSTCSVKTERDNIGKSYSRQQITIDRLKEKLEHLETELKVERNKILEVRTLLSLKENNFSSEKDSFTKEIEKLKASLSEKETICKEIMNEKLEKEDEIRKLLDKNKKLNESMCKSDDRKKEELMEVEDMIRKSKDELERVNLELETKRQNLLDRSARRAGESDSDDGICVRSEGKPVNKFTLRSPKLNASRSASPDSPSLETETVIEVPSLDVYGLADIIEDLELNEESPRKKLGFEETEKKITGLILRLLVTSNNVVERIEQHTERYRCQYEGLLTSVRDISSRLRDHVCIGTAEPIMPVFVMLEEIKLQLKELVQSASQVGALIYEDRMKLCWTLVYNYMAMLRQENMSLRDSPKSDTTPTQTGTVRRRINRSTQDVDNEQTSQKRKRYIPCTRLTIALLFLVALAITISLVIHLNCRMTVSENQYCPLDGIIKRQIIGTPPM